MEYAGERNVITEKINEQKRVDRKKMVPKDKLGETKFDLNKANSQCSCLQKFKSELCISFRELRRRMTSSEMLQKDTQFL